MDLVLKINDESKRIGVQVSPVSLDIEYGAPRRLVLTAPRGSGIKLAHDCELTVDGTVRFRGSIVAVQPDPMLAGQDQFTAVDRVEDARYVQVGKFREGDAAYLLEQAFLFYDQRPLAEILDLATQVFGPELAALEACPSESDVFGGVKAGSVKAFIAQNGGFPEFMNAMLASLPGHTWLWNSTSLRWEIINVYASPVRTLVVEDGLIESHPLQVSIEDRYSTVRLVGARVDVTVPDAFVFLTPAWDKSLEETWDISKAANAQNPGDALSTAYSNVYRRFSFDPNSTQVDPDGPIEVRQKIRVGQDNFEWVTVEVADIDFVNGFVYTKSPACRGPRLDRCPKQGPDTFRPGKARPPLDMVMAYSKRLIVPPPEAVAGPDGPIYHEYGIERELYIREPDNRNVTAARARLYLDAFSSPIVAGSLPILGDFPDWLWNLNARVNIRTRGGRVTHAENAQAVVHAARYDFGQRVTTLELNSDQSRFLGSSLAI